MNETQIKVSSSRVVTYNLFGLLNTSLELGNIPLRLIFGQLLDFILLNDAQRLLCVQLALADMAGITGSRAGHERGAKLRYVK